MSEHNHVSMTAEGSRQVYHIKDLPTKSVTLYTTRAHITREIDNVQLQPGVKEVEIFGLSPTVDEHSIQVEGQGITVVDMSVQLVPTRDIFEEIYPEDSDMSDDESDSEQTGSDDEGDATKTIQEEIKDLKLKVTQAIEKQNSANDRLATWDRLAKSVSTQYLDHEQTSKLLNKYATDRRDIFETYTAATQELEDLRGQVKRKEKEKDRAGRDVKKQKEKLRKLKAKEQRRKELKMAEKEKQATYLKQERLRYWATKVYKVTLLLESPSLDTPGSSRRNSLLDSVTLASSPRQEAKVVQSNEGASTTSQSPVSLVLSYVTKEAGWSPRYDLRISSVQKTATIIYRTEFLNRTSETWKDAKLSFSTSQTSYQGLDDAVPFMHAWRIKLSRTNQGDGGLLSHEESDTSRTRRPDLEVFNRADVFGLVDNFIPDLQSKRPLEVQQNAQNTHSDSHGNLFNAKRSMISGSRLSGVDRTALYGSSDLPSMPKGRAARMQKKSLVPSSIFSTGQKRNSTKQEEYVTHDSTIDDSDEEQEGNMSNFYDCVESSWEDNGLTATYDVPGTRTLEPSSLTRRHKIASLNASNIHLSHICVPKLRSAAFLRAKIRNPSSSVTLLKGSAGVTLDGSFLGNMNLPRVSPGQIFDLPLGVDPAIHVNYPKPSVHRSTQGIIFNKESAQVFTRSIWLNNTRPQRIEMLVLDQVPVSEDDRLRIGILTPRSLVEMGDSVKAGVSAKEGSSGALEQDKKKDEGWGSAVAKLKKGGEINWTVKLEGGKGCLLKLEYEAKLPPSEKIVLAAV